METRYGEVELGVSFLLVLVSCRLLVVEWEEQRGRERG